MSFFTVIPLYVNEGKTMAITKSNERTKYELADAMKHCLKSAPV